MNGWNDSRPSFQEKGAGRARSAGSSVSLKSKATAVLAAAAMVLSLGALGGCTATAPQTTTDQASQSHTVVFDAGSAQSQYGIQNIDNMPYEKEYNAGDTVSIPNIMGEDYDVFIPGYVLTGWQRSDTNEVIPVEQASAPASESDSGSGSNASANDADEVEVEAYGVTEETSDGTVSAEAVEAEEGSASGSASADSPSTGSSSNSGSAAASSSSQSPDDDSVAEFVMPDNDVTLTAQWTPMTIDVYAADGEGAEPTYVATVDLSGEGIQGSAEDTSVWQSYNTFNQGEARVFTSAFYFPLEAVFEQAGIEVAPTDMVTLGEDFITGESNDTASVEHDWQFYTDGMFYPNTTCDTYTLDGAQAVIPSLSLTYKESRSTSKTEPLSTIVQRSLTEGISDQSAELCPRALYGVPTASYDKNTYYSGSQHPYNVNQILIVK